MGLRGIGSKALSDRRGEWKQQDWQDPTLSHLEQVRLFISKLKLTAGRYAGLPFHLRPWQQEITEGIYRQGVRTALVTMGRKNGKTAYATGLAADHLFGPSSEPRGEVYSAASDRNQAGRVFRELEAIILADDQLVDRCNIQRFAKKIEVLYGPGEGSIYEALSSDARKAHSLSPSFVICDELAQWPHRDLYDNLITGTGARETPLVVVISTMSSDPNHVMTELVSYGKQVNDGLIDDPSFVSFIYTTPIDADIYKEENWYASNPALGDFRSLAELRQFAEQAKRIPTKETVLRNLYLNQPVSLTSGLISRQAWRDCAKDEPLNKGEEIYLGLDLSVTTDLTALVAVSAKSGDRLKAWFWKPGDLIDEQAKRDRVPYAQWVKDGWIEAPKGKAIDYSWIAYQIGVICHEYKVVSLAYDRTFMKYLVKELDAIGIESYVSEEKDKSKRALHLSPWGQGFIGMAPAVTAFETSVVNGHLKHDSNPVLTFCVANAIVQQDAAGNRKFDKSAAKYRIDGAVAAAMAIGLKAKQPSKKQPEYQFFAV